MDWHYIAMTTDLTIFSFPDDVIEAFTFGDCWHLARTLNVLAGYPIITFQYPGIGKDLWAHAANRLPDGRIIDVEGASSEEDWQNQWCEIMGVWPCETYIRTWEPEDWDKELLDGEFEFLYPEISKEAIKYAELMISKLA